jgi:L-iditol 2-dehydrogenase
MSEKMKVVAIVDDRKVEIKEVNKPIAHSHQVIMKVHGCSICTFEQRMFLGVAHIPYPFVGGHEVFGEIDSIGSSVDPKVYPVGQKIVGRLLNACGECYFCRKGESAHCVNQNKIQDDQFEIKGLGGLAEYVALDSKQVFKVAQDTSLEIGVFAEPLACVIKSFEIGRPEMGDDIVVLGGGIMGQLHILLGKLSGCRVILSEPDPVRREHAIKLGCDFAINPLETDPVEFVKSITEGRGAEVVFNATAIAPVAQQAIEMTARLGRCIMYSTIMPDKPLEVSGKMLHNTGKVLTGTVNPSVESFFKASNMISKKIIDTKSLIYGVYDLNDAQKAFDDSIDPKTMRCVVKFSNL